MYIEELKEEDLGCGDWQLLSANDCCKDTIVVSDAKRLLVGAGARALFYPTLLYNVVRNKVESEFRWWDWVDEVHAIKYETFGTALIRRLTSPFIVDNDCAVPFPSDVLCLKELGVCGVVTLNESYETLVPTSLYHAHDIEHLVIPTRDYLFAPSYGDICEAVEFIHNNASSGKTTYVHCKAGRGRSTTIVLCYLVEHRQMSPDAAYEYVRAIRPRVRLASSQWQAVQGYYLHRVKKTEGVVFTNNSVKLCPRNFEPEAFNEESLVLVAESDLEGYDESFDSSLVGNKMLAELSLPCRAQLASQAAITRLSCLWLGSHAGQKLSSKKLVTTEQLGNVGVDIRVY